MSQLIKPDGSPLVAASKAPPMTARYMRDSKSGAIASRISPMTQHRDEVRRAWKKAAGLSLDLIQNSGRLKGATDQVLSDTLGVGLTCTPDPDLSGLGYDEKEKADWIRLVKRCWTAYWRNAREVDMQGKISGPQGVDIGLRWYIVFGEVTGVFDYFDSVRRAKYGLTTGTKLRMYPPSRLVQETNEPAGLFQGVQHDENGRAVSYRFETSSSGLKQKRDYAAYDTDGRPMVMHIFDPVDSEDVRGISQLAPAFKKHIQAEMLDDATLQMATLQTILGIVLTSEAPSQDAYEALEVLRDSHDEAGKGYASEYLDYLGSQLDRSAENRISVGVDPQVSHLGPGEKLSLETAAVPGVGYQPFSNSLARDMARAIGCSYGALTMDYSNATYSSVRMENSSIWSVVMRRRERISAPHCQMVYGNWLDEEIGEGRIPFKGGYRAFRANRNRVSACNWQGPAKPTADDLKSAKASTERLQNGTSSIAIETGDLGQDPDALFEERKREHDRYVEAGMESPYAARARKPEPKPEDTA